MVGIVGGGITGLYLSWLLQQEGIPFRLFEAKDRVGGNIASHQLSGYLVEAGPNSLTMSEKMMEVVEELGMESRLVEASPTAKFRYVLKKGEYAKLPSGPASFIFGSFFPLKAKRRVFKERKIPVRQEGGETVDVFFRRRFGDFVADYLVSPFVAGIYAGSAAELSMDHAFPKVKEMEREYGSVIKGFRASMKGGTSRKIFSFRGGIEELIERLSKDTLRNIELNASIRKIEKNGKGFRLEMKDGTFDCDQLVLTVPAWKAVDLLDGIAPELEPMLAAVPYPPVAIVHTAYKKDDVDHPLDGFGALHNALEPSGTLGSIFTSTVFPYRCPADQVLMATFVGGHGAPEKGLLSDEETAALVDEDHRKLLGVKGKPVFRKIFRYKKAIPQYRPEIGKLWDSVEPLEKEHLFLGGNWIGGISVENGIRRAEYLLGKVRLSYT